MPRKLGLRRDGECVAAELGALKAKTGHWSEMCLMVTPSKSFVDMGSVEKGSMKYNTYGILVD